MFCMYRCHNSSVISCEYLWPTVIEHVSFVCSDLSECILRNPSYRGLKNELSHLLVGRLKLNAHIKPS